MSRTVVLICDPEERGYWICAEGFQRPVGIELFKNKDEILKVICPHYTESTDNGRGYCEIKKQVKVDPWHGEDLGDRCEWDLSVEERKDLPNLSEHIESIMESNLGRGSDEAKEILRILTRSKYQEYRDAGVEVWHENDLPLNEDDKRKLREEGVEVF